ncbi:SdrD B-like domain-containing protein [Streptococcus dysgalactiae]|uniref:SdrD B-like domain-containing protein n=1 Tax=Streptococcus dysgalactiae TaxID=1334 RepID=UPI003FD7D137
MGTKSRKFKIEGETIVFEREKSRFSIRKNKCYGACSVFLGLTILTLAMAGGNVKAEEVEGEANASTVVVPEVADRTNLEETNIPSNPVLTPSAFRGGADDNDELIKDAPVNVIELDLENNKLKDPDPNVNELNFSEADSLNAKFTIEAEKVSAGDSFEVAISDNLSVNGITIDDFSTRPDVNIKDNDGGIIAKPTFDPKRHVLTYTFTDYAALKRNIKASAVIDLSLDTKYFSKPVNNEEFFVSIRDRKKTLTRDVTFTLPAVETITKANTDALFTKVSITDKSFTFVTQINPLGNNIRSKNGSKFTTTISNPDDATYNVDLSDVKLKIYQVKPSEMSKTLEQDYDNTPSAKDVTNQFANKIIQTIDKIQINWDKTSFNPDEGYVVVLDKVDQTKFDNNTDTTLSSLLKDNSHFYDDGGDAIAIASYFVVYNKENATASDAKYSIGDFVWEDTNKNGLQDKDNEKGISGVAVRLLDAEGKEIKKQTTGPNGEYKFTDLNGNTTYFLKFESVPGYVRTKQNSQDQAGSILKTDESDSDASSTGLAIAKITNFNRTDIDAGYYKEEVKKGSFTEHHVYRTVDEQGNVVEEEFENVPVTEGTSKDTFNTAKRDRAGYKLVEVTSSTETAFNLDGTAKENHYRDNRGQEVTYVYVKTLVAPKGDFVEHHVYRTVDEQGNVVEEEFENVPVTEGTSKDTFNTAKRDRAGYKLVEVTSSTETAFNLDGTAKENHYRDNRGQEVTYVYVRVRINDTRSNLVTFEEVLPNESGQNAGTVEIEENAPIVELEYSSQEGMSGENAGTVEIEENSPIVELDYPSQEGMSGENTGTVEVEENAPIVELDYPSQEGMSGENSGQQTIEEDTPTVTIEEKPVVKPVSSQPSKAELPATGERSETAVTVLGLVLSSLGMITIKRNKKSKQ